MFEAAGRDDRRDRRIGRRSFVVTSGAALAGFLLWKHERGESASVEAAPKGPPKQVTIVEFTDAGER